MEAFGEEEEVEDEQWKEGDGQLINPSVGLMKTSVALVKRVLATVRGEGGEETTLQLHEYDGLLEQVRQHWSAGWGSCSVSVCIKWIVKQWSVKEKKPLIIYSMSPLVRTEARSQSGRC